MRKVFQNIITVLCHLFGRKKILFNASEIDREFLNNFETIGDYKRVFTFQSQVNSSQTKPNLSKGASDRKDIYVPPINSFSAASPLVCFSRTEVKKSNNRMETPSSKEFRSSHLNGKIVEHSQNENFVYVKKYNGYINKNCTDNTQWKSISYKECLTQEDYSPLSSYFNMHHLKSNKGKKAESVYLLDLYMS